MAASLVRTPVSALFHVFDSFILALVDASLFMLDPGNHTIAQADDKRCRRSIRQIECNANRTDSYLTSIRMAVHNPNILFLLLLILYKNYRIRFFVLQARDLLPTHKNQKQFLLQYLSEGYSYIHLLQNIL